MTRRIGAIAAAGIGAIHLVLAPEYLSEQLYIGLLFIAGAIASGYVALALWRAQSVGAWVLGGLVSIGMAVGLVLSRTVGLPGFHESEWEASGILSLLLEGTFLTAALATTRQLTARSSAAA